MSAETSTIAVSKGMLWTGRIMSAIPILLTAFASVLKLINSPSVVEGTVRLGYSQALIRPVGAIEMACIIVYAIPRTSVLGAILFTGLFGGATATLVRVGDPSFPFPIILGMMVWGGLFFRDPRVRALIPLRSPAE
ncbi:MAG TPA: DoxX family protein [Terriglobales bacterium]|nr:DoxX family protein [Terriglobales bacterium]